MGRILIAALITISLVSVGNAVLKNTNPDLQVKKPKTVDNRPVKLKVDGNKKMDIKKNPDDNVNKTDAEWQKILTPEQYRVMREKGTEMPFKGKYWDTNVKGIYKCAACGNVLFESKTKFEAGCGWPSFYSPADAKGVKYNTDKSHGMTRTEVTCAKCGAHLGHVFDDGPEPTGKRYCINSVSLELVPDK